VTYVFIVGLAPKVNKTLKAMNILDCYKILNVSKGSNWDQVKRSYYTLAKKYHPDLNFGDPFFESRFKKISQAYRVLDLHYKKQETIKNIWEKSRRPKSSNRKAYPSVESIVTPPKRPKSAKEEAIRAKESDPKWKKRIKEILFKYENKWAPLTVRQGVTVDSSLAVKGGIIRIKTAYDNFQVKIPAGIEHQTQLRIPGKGEKSFFNDKRGDLFLNVRVIPAGRAAPGNTNMFYEKKVSRKDVNLNRVFTLNTFQGPIKFFIPKKTRDGESFVLKAKPHAEGSGFRVNHIVTLRIT
jgi:curved DNA-binding protein CbpA